MYIELHSHSCFSLLDGASRPEALVARASRAGDAGAGTDRQRRAVWGSDLLASC